MSSIVQEPVVIVETPPLSAYSSGWLDAQEGRPFCPEEMWFWFGDMLSYTEGFESVRGECEITRDFKAQWPEREEAIEDDYEDIRRGY